MPFYGSVLAAAEAEVSSLSWFHGVVSCFLGEYVISQGCARLNTKRTKVFFYLSYFIEFFKAFVTVEDAGVP